LLWGFFWRATIYAGNLVMQWLVGDNGGMANEITLAEIIDTLWIHPENAEWTPKG
jgi:hypothetical protein